MIKDSKLILVGVITAAHGIKGNILVKSYTFPIENLLKLKLVDGDNISVSIKEVRINPNKELIVCKNANSNDRNYAEELVGKKLYCLRNALPELDNNEFYIEDLRQLPVLDLNEDQIGTVIEVFNFGAGDLVEIDFLHDLGREIFPFTKEIFPEITKNYVVFNKAAK